MAETGALLDAHGDPIAPGLAWFDTRGEAQQADLERALGLAELACHTGLTVLRMSSLVKLRWLFDQGLSRKRADRWLNVAEWIALRLGAEPVAELSLASRTGFLDQRSQDWWPAAFEWLGVQPRLMPGLVRAGTGIGRVRAGLLPGADGAAIAIAGHDHLCAAVGSGATAPGDVLDSCGTALALVRGAARPLSGADKALSGAASTLSGAAIERLVASGISVGTHVLDDQQALLTGFAEGPALLSFLRLLGVDEADHAALDLQAAAIDAGQLRVEGIDQPGPSLVGISSDASPARVWRAALDAVERRTLELLHVMDREVGRHRRVIVVGGWARNPAVQAAKRQILGPCLYADVEEAGVRGAAQLAGRAAGIVPDLAAWAFLPDSTPDRVLS
jgi:sugar (pentulose or hexulose) kinase